MEEVCFDEEMREARPDPAAFIFVLIVTFNMTTKQHSHPILMFMEA